MFYYYFICFPVLDLFLFSPSFSSIFYISIMKINNTRDWFIQHSINRGELKEEHAYQ